MTVVACMLSMHVGSTSPHKICQCHEILSVPNSTNESGCRVAADA